MMQNEQQKGEVRKQLIFSLSSEREVKVVKALTRLKRRQKDFIVLAVEEILEKYGLEDMTSVDAKVFMDTYPHIRRFKEILEQKKVDNKDIQKELLSYCRENSADEISARILSVDLSSYLALDTTPAAAAAPLNRESPSPVSVPVKDDTPLETFDDGDNKYGGNEEVVMNALKKFGL